MKIVYFIPTLDRLGGMERVLAFKASYLADSFGYDVHIIVTESSSNRSYYYLSDKITVHNLDINFEEIYHKSIFKKFILFRQKQKLNRKRVEEELFNIKPDIAVSLCRREVNFLYKIQDGSKKVVEMHMNKIEYRIITNKHISAFIRNFIHNIWVKQLVNSLKKYDKFVVLTKADAALWTELNNVAVIYNPIYSIPSHTSSLENKSVIAVGRFVPQKGFDYLIDSWSIVSEKHKDWTLTIYGDGWLKDSYIKQIKSHGLEDNCILHEPVTDLENKYCENSIFAFSSRYEGFGLVLTEAMSCGLPPVSFDCNFGPTDIINSKDCGILIKTGDVKAMAEKINLLIEDEELRKSMSAHAILRSKDFYPEVIMSQWKSLFEIIILR